MAKILEPNQRYVDNEMAHPMAAAKSRLQTAIEVILPVSYRCLHWLFGAMLTAVSTFFIPADSPGIAGGIILASIFLFLFVAGTVLMMELGFPFLKRGLAIALTSAVILIAACLAFGTLPILEFTLALFVATLSLYLMSTLSTAKWSAEPAQSKFLQRILSLSLS